jgi:very-short-patch-repair endonuclease/energy-coupling factor transporter ATP-binding protein EcfA2
VPEVEQYDDKTVATLLFRTIQAVCAADNIITNINSYQWHPLISSLLAYDAKQEYINVYQNDSEGRLFTIKKPGIIACPEPPENIKKWIEEGYENPKNNITYLASIDDEIFEDDDNRVESLDSWGVERENWIKEIDRLEQLNRLFNNFYNIVNTLKASPEDYELVYAFGFFQDLNNKEIRHPLFVKKVKIGFYDVKDNVIGIFDTPSGVQYDSNFLSKINNSDVINNNQILELLVSKGVMPYDKNDATSFLQLVAHTLSNKAEFYNDDVKDYPTTDRYIIKYAPMFILRRRGSGLNNYLTKVIDAINNGVKVPKHIGEILKPRAKKHSSDSNTNEKNTEFVNLTGEHPEILFTKPTNKEQMQIALEIQKNDAVEVQGPPGTGKTYTIANLIGHLLSEGKTILITSEKDKALTVLRDKLDENLKALCVSVLDDNSKELESSVREIIYNNGVLSSNSLKEDIKTLTETRKKVLDEIYSLRKQMLLMRQKEVRGIVIAGESFSVVDAAKYVSDNKALLKYLPDSDSQIDVLPISKDDVKFLYSSNDLISTDEEEELGGELQDYNSLLAPKTFEHMLAEYDSATKSLAVLYGENSEYQENYDENYISKNGTILFKNASLSNLDNLLKTLELCKKYKNWELKVMDDAATGEGYRKQWNILLQSIENVSDKSNKFATKRLGYKADLGDVEEEKLINVLQKIRNHISQNGSLGFLFKLLNSDVKQVIQNVRVNGKEISNIEECEFLLSRVYYDKSVQQLSVIWNQIFENTDMVKFEDIEQPRESFIENVGFKIKEDLEWEKTYLCELKSAMKEAGFNITTLNAINENISIPSKIIAEVCSNMEQYINTCKLFLLKKQFNDSVRFFESKLQKNTLKSSTLCNQLSNALVRHNYYDYAQAFHKYKNIYDKYECYNHRIELLNTLAKYAPKWSEAISTRENEHGTQNQPCDYSVAWKTMRLNAELNKIFNELVNEKEKLVEEYLSKLRNITGQLAAKKAWQNTLENMSCDSSLMSNLKAWAALIKRIGKGTGKNAEKFRRQARECLTEGQMAVPAWIVPVTRALDMFDPSKIRFDVAIIDEASQSSLAALAVSFLANKIIVVGDSKQVSPMLVGTDLERRHQILKKYLEGYVKDWLLFDGRTSYYELVGTVYDAKMLKEHFRCVPEIIGYCNKEYYENQIIPLRDSNKNSTKPGVVPYRVEGRRNSDKSKINEKEALNIVSLIKACLSQPEYDGKTFGVISLLGKEQADKINEYIATYINNPAIVEERQLICGESAFFQGDERDIIFISMVDDDESVRNVTADDIAKRYNVAVSRAKDQLWIVYSFDYTLLKQNSLQYKLLEYADHYETYLDRIVSVDDLADSPFEIEVAKYLLAKGYKIKQQYRVGNYSIDIVVIGENGKIAIECDGERWHSGEKKIMEDMNRQSILQRVGWTFIRIRGGIYFKDKENTMLNVCEKLHKHGIEPMSDMINKANEIEHNELLECVKRKAVAFLNKWEAVEKVSQSNEVQISNNKNKKWSLKVDGKRRRESRILSTRFN